MESLGSLLPLLGLMVIIWFILIRPQQKKQKERTQLLSAVEIGDDIVTIGGLHGRIRDLTDDYMDVLVAEPDIVLRFQRDSLMRVVGDEPEDDDLSDDELTADEA